MKTMSDDRLGNAVRLCAELSEKRHKRKTRNAYLYLVKSGDYYKIGRTANLNKRLESYVTHSPFEIELIAYTKTQFSEKLERRAHDRYFHLRHRGEWYKLDEMSLIDIMARYFSFKNSWSHG